MATYTFTETGRTYAATKYNRTTRRWLDGGPDIAVEIHDDDSGTALKDLTDNELIDVTGTIAESERENVGDLADAAAEEIERRLEAMGEKVAGWDGESAADLASLLNDVDDYTERANEALRYVPGRPSGYHFDERDWYDASSLGWHGEREPSAERNDVYACDKSGVFVVLVAGTTDDGWTTETPE